LRDEYYVRIQKHVPKNYYVCSSVSPYLRIGTTHEDKLSVNETNFPYMLDPNISLWLEDEHHVIRDDFKLNPMIRSYVKLKLVVEGRH
jgi:hypothetical protein